MNRGYEIKNSAEKVLIRFYGDILMQDEWWKEDSDACPEDIVKALKGNEEKPIEIRINSGGGSVFGGMAIYNILKAHKGKKTVYVDGIAASIASVIMLAGDEINVPKNATVMIHDPWSVCVGSAEDMEKAKNSLEVIKDTILCVYEEHSKLSRDELSEKMKNETWMSGAVAATVFDIKESEEVKAKACATSHMMSFYKNLPPGVQITSNAEFNCEPIGEPNDRARSIVNKALLDEIKEYIHRERKRR